MAQRKCYGYDVGTDGALVVNPTEASVARWIFDRYLSGDSLGKIAAGLEEQGIPSPTGRPKWNREAINKLISNEKYRGRVLLQKTISAGSSQFKTTASCPGISIWILMRPLFLMRYSGMLSRRNCSVQISQKENLPFNYSFDATKLSNACCDAYGTGTFISAFRSTSSLYG